MTPRRARLYTWLFLGLAGCASINVMLLQQRLPMRGMGGVYGESAAGGAATRTAATAASLPPASVTTVSRGVKVAASPTPNPVAAQVELLQAIQRELNSAGHYAGTVDGRPSRALTAAIVAYEYQQGLAVTGEPSDDLLKRLILGSGSLGRRAHLPGEIVPGSPADHLVRWVIETLNRIGHEAGKPQSKLDMKAIQAIRAFEAGELMPPTGRISEAMVRQLERRLR